MLLNVMFYIHIFSLHKQVNINPGQSAPVLNGCALVSYDNKRRSFTLVVYDDHIRYFTVSNDHRKQQS